MAPGSRAGRRPSDDPPTDGGGHPRGALRLARVAEISSEGGTRTISIPSSAPESEPPRCVLHEAERRVLELNQGKRIIPTIFFPDGSLLVEPSDADLARQLGLQLRAERSFFDLIVIGGGPAGLTASMYAAREGIDALVLDASALGGQAGVTERIDNYPGFPEGIKGAELAERIVQQARRYDVTLLAAVGVKGISREGDYILVETDQGDPYCGHSALIATGSSYRRLGVPGEEDLIGAGIHF